MTSLFFLLSIAFFFYVFIPGIGAFYIRSRWRVFRSAVLEASLYSNIDYATVRRNSGFVGMYRMIGGFSGVDETERIIWLKSGDVSVKVDISSADFYLLPGAVGLEYEGMTERNELLPSTGMLQKLSWKHVFSIDEGSRFLVAGPLFIQDGRGQFRATSNNRLLLLQFDGDAKSIMRRSIWAGRQKNEYWNAFTPGSMLLGAFSLFVAAYLMYTGAGNLNMLSMTLSLSLLPITPLLPPGVLFFYLYRSLWERARYLRAQRDLFLLPVRFIGDYRLTGSTTLHLPNGELYGVRKFDAGTDISKFSGKIRTGRYIAGKQLQGREYYAFGRVSGKDSNELLEIADPLVENIILPGEPFELSRICQRLARRTELFSGAAFGFGFLINLFLLYQGISLVVR
ncbi:MAG: hypothetical protein JXB03_07860 [Spirochaetales bacterium]|nr:hypothetical protein [Spirochaetales bacterium]